MLHTSNLHRNFAWVHVVLLHSVVLSKSEKCRGWAIACDANNAVDSRYRLETDIFSTNIPRPRLTIRAWVSKEWHTKAKVFSPVCVLDDSAIS